MDGSPYLTGVNVACAGQQTSPTRTKGKKDFAEVAIIVPGPKEPKNLDIYLEPLLEDLRAYGPDGAVPASPSLMAGLQAFTQTPGLLS